MIRNSFIHMAGVGAQTEQKFWDAGVCNWDCLQRLSDAGCSKAKAEKIAREVETSVERLESRDAKWFSDRMKSGKTAWRMFPDFRSGAVFLDIETTGLSADTDVITTIATFDGEEIRHYIHGENLDEFPNDIDGAELLVTYNGKTFDIPFIERYFDIQLEAGQLDLRYVLGALGYKGGLKNIEQQLGFAREGFEEIDGFMAVLLWDEYRSTGNVSALETLLAYNIQDVLSLDGLAVEAFNLFADETEHPEIGLESHASLPENPFDPDPDVIQKIISKQFWMSESY